MKILIFLLLLLTASSAIAPPADAQAPTPTAAGEPSRKKLFVSGAFGLSIANPADWEEAGIRGDVELEKALHFAGAFGVKLTPRIMFDAEFSYRNADLDELTIRNGPSAGLNGQNKIWAGLINGYFTLMPRSDFSPYFTAGVGFARHEVDISGAGGLGLNGATGEDFVGAFQVGTGAHYNIDANTQLWGGYRFFGTDRPTIDGTEFDYTSHEIMLGIRQYF